MALIHHPQFAAWLDDYCLTLDRAAYVFGVSRRTVSRWRSSDQISAGAAQLARSIERQSPPWNGSFRRSLHNGLTNLPWEWRDDFAKANGYERWQDLPRESPAVKRQRATMRRLQDFL